MLEHRVLILHPWDPFTERLPIVAESGSPLGFACWQRSGAAAWWRWLARPVLAVHEQGDEPLVFTVRRSWGLLPRREVLDADGNRVGMLQGAFLLDPGGRRLGHREREALGGRTVFRDRAGRTLAELTQDGGLHLTFNAEVENEPFAKMLLLAAALGG
jgi:hypothetical protein